MTATANTGYHSDQHRTVRARFRADHLSAYPASSVRARSSPAALDTAEPHIRSPLTTAGTKIPHTRGRRARKDRTNLYRGVFQPGHYAVRLPRHGEG
jgi:hypothetical protein